MSFATLRQARSATVLAASLLALVLSGSLLVGCSQDELVVNPTGTRALEQRFVSFTTNQGPTTMSKDIGPTGGTIVAGPATLFVPAGALSETVTITVTGTEGSTTMCELLPHGQTFDVDVVLTLEKGSPDDHTILWYNDVSFVWQDVGGEVVGNSVRTELEHFSKYMTSLVN